MAVTQDLKECCDEWVGSLKPTKLRPGTFTEARVCPTCGSRYDVEFQYVDSTYSFTIEYKVLSIKHQAAG